MAAPCVYEKAALLVDLWRLKQSKADERPFPALRDLYMATLDMISGVAFGMDSSKASLKREIAQMHCPEGTFSSELRPADFPASRNDPDTEALLNISEMISIAQRSPFPALAQWLALLNPRHARAHCAKQH